MILQIIAYLCKDYNAKLQFYYEKMSYKSANNCTFLRFFDMQIYTFLRFLQNISFYFFKSLFLYCSLCQWYSYLVANLLLLVCWAYKNTASMYYARRLCFVIQDGVLLMVLFSEKSGFATTTAMLFCMASECTFRLQIDDD